MVQAIMTQNGCLAERVVLGIFFDSTSKLEDVSEGRERAVWVNYSGWKTDKPVADWFGISADADGHVAVLLLPENRCTGCIPRELGMLPALVELDLSSNLLTGPIPRELCKLSSLMKLDLSFNSLTGVIPAELGELSALTTLDVSYNRLHGTIPEELGGLRSLQLLGLQRNRLSGSIPLLLSELTTLQAFYWPQNDGFSISGGPKHRGPVDAMRSSLQLYSFRDRNVHEARVPDRHKILVHESDFAPSSSVDMFTAADHVDHKNENDKEIQDEEVQTYLPGRFQTKSLHRKQNSVIPNDLPRRRPGFSLDTAGRTVPPSASTTSICGDSDSDNNGGRKPISRDITRQSRSTHMRSSRHLPIPMDFPRRRSGFSLDTSTRSDLYNVGSGGNHDGQEQTKKNTTSYIARRIGKTKSRGLHRLPIPSDLPRRRSDWSLDTFSMGSRPTVSPRSTRGHHTEDTSGDELGSSEARRRCLSTNLLPSRRIPTLVDLPRRRSERRFEGSEGKTRLEGPGSREGEHDCDPKRESVLREVQHRDSRGDGDHAGEPEESNQRPTVSPRSTSGHHTEDTTGDELDSSGARRRCMSTNLLPSRRLPTLVDLPRRRSERRFEGFEGRTRLEGPGSKEGEHDCDPKRESVLREVQHRDSRGDGDHAVEPEASDHNMMEKPGRTRTLAHPRGSRWGRSRAGPFIVDLPRRSRRYYLNVGGSNSDSALHTSDDEMMAKSGRSRAIAHPRRRRWRLNRGRPVMVDLPRRSRSYHPEVAGSHSDVARYTPDEEAVMAKFGCTRSLSRWGVNRGRPVTVDLPRRSRSCHLAVAGSFSDGAWHVSDEEAVMAKSGRTRSRSRWGLSRGRPVVVDLPRRSRSCHLAGRGGKIF